MCFPRRSILAFLILMTLAPALLRAEMPVILSMQERAALQDAWLEVRLETVLPQLMRREEIDMWVVVSREYNEDPVFWSMKPATWLAARRRTILVFFDRGEGPIERLAVARYDVGTFRKAWEPEQQPDQWTRLAEIIQERNPRHIALNYSKHFALADGITRSEFNSLQEALPSQYRKRVVSGEKLAIGWLEWRIPDEQAVYPTICRIAHEIIAEGLSNRVIQPGFTSTEDVQWWYRSRIRELGLTTWFHPSVSVQRSGAPEHSGSFGSRPGAEIIRRGDLIHVDFGIHYLGLNTDTQQHAYVLRVGEEDAPEGLKNALRQGNRLQDILLSNFVLGRSGNEMLKRSLAQAKQEGLVPRSLSEYSCGSRSGRHGVRCAASGTQSLSFNFKCRQQSRSPHAARNPQGTGGLWPISLSRGFDDASASPAASLRELDSQDPCSRPHPNTRTDS